MGPGRPPSPAGPPAAPRRPVTVSVDGVAWPVHGAQLAIVEDGRVLLQLRPWPPGWELPGGHCDGGEDPAGTAEREAEEETGLRVRVGELVGVYSWSGLRRAGDAVYLGEVVGGRPRRTLEAWARRFVSPGDMPATAFPWCRQRVVDAIARSRGAPPVHRVQRVTPLHVAAFAVVWLLRAPLERFLSRLRGR